MANLYHWCQETLQDRRRSRSQAVRQPCSVSAACAFSRLFKNERLRCGRYDQLCKHSEFESRQHGINFMHTSIGIHQRQWRISRQCLIWQREPGHGVFVRIEHSQCMIKDIAQPQQSIRFHGVQHGIATRRPQPTPFAYRRAEDGGESRNRNRPGVHDLDRFRDRNPGTNSGDPTSVIWGNDKVVLSAHGGVLYPPYGVSYRTYGRFRTGAIAYSTPQSGPNRNSRLTRHDDGHHCRSLEIILGKVPWLHDNFLLINRLKNFLRNRPGDATCLRQFE